jgi:anthranilate synthase component 1
MTTSTTIDTDLVTPLQAYLHLRLQGRASFLLESVEQGRLGRYSFVGCGSRLVALHEAEALAAPVVGYLAYDHIAHLEPTGPLPADGPDIPESRFIVADLFLRFDHVTGTADVLHGDPDAVAGLLAQPPTVTKPTPVAGGETTRTPERAEHERRVRRVQELIRRGDAFQVVLSQRAERATSATPLAVYRALRRINPSPYLFLLELDDLALVGSSPETHVKVEGTRASLNPIAGTT